VKPSAHAGNGMAGLTAPVVLARRSSTLWRCTSNSTEPSPSRG